MARLTAELMPGRSGANYTAEFAGNPNAQALERATEITVIAGAAGNIEVTPDDAGTTWYDTGENAINGLMTMLQTPVCRGIRVAGIAAAATPPVRILVRHGM